MKRRIARTVEMMLDAQRDGDQFLMRTHLQVLLGQLWQRRQQRTQEAILRLIARRSAGFDHAARVAVLVVLAVGWLAVAWGQTVVPASAGMVTRTAPQNYPGQNGNVGNQFTSGRLERDSPHQEGRRWPGTSTPDAAIREDAVRFETDGPTSGTSSSDVAPGGSPVATVGSVNTDAFVTAGWTRPSYDPDRRDAAFSKITPHDDENGSGDASRIASGGTDGFSAENRNDVKSPSTPGPGLDGSRR